MTAEALFDEPVTDAVLLRATDRAQQQRPTVHARAARYAAQSQTVYIGFADHSEVGLLVGNYPELAGLSATQLDKLVVGFAGSALCLPEQDLHISIAGLMSAASPAHMDMAAAEVGVRSAR